MLCKVGVAPYFSCSPYGHVKDALFPSRGCEFTFS